jgi:hypothetical protein
MDVEKILAWNQSDSAPRRAGHFLGSWTTVSGLLQFNAFVPNWLYLPRVAVNLLGSMVCRAEWVSEEHFHYPWADNFEESVLRAAAFAGGC